MLHAVSARKARLHHFRNAGTRVPLEDVVTSTVFGPLLFLAETDRDRVLRALLVGLGFTDKRWSGLLTLSFWIKRPTDPRIRPRSIEPDLIISDERGIVLLTEIKWGAPLDDGELAGQWACLDERERARARHLLIVRDKRPYHGQIRSDERLLRRYNLYPWPFKMHCWSDIAHSLEALGRSDAAAHLRSWARTVAHFLRTEDGFAMRGWTRLELNAVEAYVPRFRQAWWSNLHIVSRVERKWANG
ncbi:hypothetical protein FHS92_000643 [Sphingobium subterraneum]|uniref:Uncharacterized protein n=1 Tax=Sphingobium subterraneum TaxID=627688 RepID=A0A841J090_9SPHN|nr:hypothetical protein [Sphingobium subterraneum]